MRSKPAFLACLRAHFNSLEAATLIPNLWLAVVKTSCYSNSLMKVLRILARLMKGWRMKSRKEVLTVETIVEPSADEIDAAERLLLLSAMPETASASA